MSVDADTLNDEDLEALVKRLETQFQPMINEAIRAAVKDNARRMALDLRKRMDSNFQQLIRDAVNETLGRRNKRERQ